MHVVDVVDHLFSSFIIATLSTGAFTLTQDVSCHLHIHRLQCVPYVKGGSAVQKTRH